MTPGFYYFRQRRVRWRIVGCSGPPDILPPGSRGTFSHAAGFGGVGGSSYIDDVGPVRLWMPNTKPCIDAAVSRWRSGAYLCQNQAPRLSASVLTDTGKIYGASGGAPPTGRFRACRRGTHHTRAASKRHHWGLVHGRITTVFPPAKKGLAIRTGRWTSADANLGPRGGRGRTRRWGAMCSRPSAWGIRAWEPLGYPGQPATIQASGD
jgi:hypothetical protein